MIVALSTIFVAGNMPYQAVAQTASSPQISIKETVSARDPFAGQSLRDTHTVRKTTYNGDTTFYTTDVRYMDRDGNPSTIERVKIDNTVETDVSFLGNKRYYFNLPVRTINDYTIYIAGNDGKIGRAIGTTHVIAGDDGCNRVEDRYIGRENIVSDLLAFAKSSQNVAFPVKEVEMVIYPDNHKGYMPADSFKMYNSDTSWVQETGLAQTSYGVRVFGDPHVKAKHGDYRVTFFSNDGNPGNYETVVVERNDGLRCEVVVLKNLRLSFVTDEGWYDHIDIKCICLRDPKVGHYTIIDDVLYDSLMTLENDTVNNTKIKFGKFDSCIFFINEKGIFKAEEIWDGTVVDYQ